MSDPRPWFVLLHRPGKSVASWQSVVDHPGFQDHVAFLKRRMQDGSLVAAGPLTDSRGHGMTILAADSLEAARALAEKDDGSVVAGILAVVVRPWEVAMSRTEGALA